jgi:hypothetical protein
VVGPTPGFDASSNLAFVDQLVNITAQPGTRLTNPSVLVDAGLLA